MDQKKKKGLSIPENKGLLHNFKFDLEIPFAPLAYPKTLYYQLDQERHTRPKVLNADVKGMCNLFVTCDLGLPLDDLNMKPHIYNLQDTHENNNNHHGNNNHDNENQYNQLHPDDLALINEDIVVSDTEEDEEAIKQQKEQQLLEQKVKEEQQKLLLEQQKMLKETESAKEKEIDFTQSFEQLKLAIEHSFIASKNIKLQDIKHPTDPERTVRKVYNILPHQLSESFKLGVMSHKSKIESISNPLEKGRFTTLFKDISFQDKNQKVFRMFVEKTKDQIPYKPKTFFEEDMIDVESEYNSLFEEDPEVVIEENDDEMLNHNQIMLKNKTVFAYSDHSTKLQQNDTILLLSKQNQSETIQNAYFQKVGFQVSLDQEKKELAVGGNLRQELGRYVKMDIIDEQQIKLMKEIDEELVEQEFGNNETKQQQQQKQQQKNSSAKKQQAPQWQKFGEDDEDEEDDDFDMDEEEDDDQNNNNNNNEDDDEDQIGSVKKSNNQPTKQYNLRDTRKAAQQQSLPSAEKKLSNPNTAAAVVDNEQQPTHEQDDNLDIFSDDDNNKNLSQQQLSQNQGGQKQSQQVVEEEEDDEVFEFQGNKGKNDSEQQSWGTKQKKQKSTEDDDFINDKIEEEDDDEEEEDQSSSNSQNRKEQTNRELNAFFDNKHSVQNNQVEEMSDDDEEFPL